MKKVTLTTDGACIGNPGPGGWACVLRFADFVGELYGCEAHTTNNRMELRAVIQGLNALTEPCDIVANTDSQYVRQGITEWLGRWKRNGWKTSEGRSRPGKPVLNKDLWAALDEATQRHTISWNWVRGHAYHKDNMRCDFLANRAAREQISSGGVIRARAPIGESHRA